VPDAFIVDAVRTPVGRRNGALRSAHPADLMAAVLRAALRRTGLDGGAVEDVILGCVDQVGAQASNIARIAVLSAGMPESVPAVTIDRQCGSSQQAVHFAAQAVLAGVHDVVIAGGVENMSMVPLASATVDGREAGHGSPRAGLGWQARYGDEEINQIRGAELIAEKWGLTREAMEQFAITSHRRAAAAALRGDFDQELIGYGDLVRDEGPRPDSSHDDLARLKVLRPEGRLTAALASQISDGAAAITIASGAAVRRYGLTPLAAVRAMAVVGSDPIMMLTGPIPATAAVLAKAGLKVGDVGAFEVNEAFASVPMAWLAETGADPALTNPVGGAIALGHPLGASGARLMATLVHQLGRTGARYGVQVMCEGGGMANATVLERI
jgi:acetyl-CoA C-acetyltransferase